MLSAGLCVVFLAIYSNFDQALEDNPKMIFLRPDWLVECIEQQKRVAFEKFMINHHKPEAKKKNTCSNRDENYF